jgi:type IV pilus biogenesis protein CpaD/CtpE
MALMAMSFTEETAVKIAHARIAFVMAIAALGLTACAHNLNESEMRMSPDFGDAVRENLAAQIADPDAHYVGTPAPGASDGARIDLAQTRYQQNQVIQPASTTASSRTVGATDNGNSGGGVGVAAGTSP